MRLHERHALVCHARFEISEAIIKAIEEHGLTYGELFSVLSQEMQTWSKYAVQDERVAPKPQEVKKP